MVIDLEFYGYMGKHSFLPIPDAMVGEILGLAETVYSYGGKIKISFLSDELQIEMDDLGDAIDMAELLSLAKVRRGKIYLTIYGEALSIGRIDDKKKIIREKIKKIEPFKTIIKILLERKKIPEEELFKILKSKFTFDDSEKFKRLLLSWGGYTEIFEYYGKKRRFTLPKKKFVDLK